MVDAINTFNFKVVVYSMQSLCPSLTTMLNNTYRIDVPLACLLMVDVSYNHQKAPARGTHWP